MGAVGGKFRKIHILQPGPATDQPFTLEAGEAIFDISGVLGPPLFPIIDNVQSLSPGLVAVDRRDTRLRA